MNYKITRRNLLVALFTGAVGGIASHFWLPGKDDSSSFDIDLPDAPDLDNPTLEIFVALSQLVTLRSSLDIPTAERMYPLFMVEPWGPHHISSSYLQILNIIGIPPYTELPDAKVIRNKLGKGQAWFTSHLLTTWYLGIYYHEQRQTQRVAYETALMFEAVRGGATVPFVEATGFGGWINPPDIKT